MNHSTNIRETEEEDEVYDAISSLLNKAITGTEQPNDESTRTELNNSVHQQMYAIEDDLEDIDETLYDDDTNSHSMHGGFVMTDIFEKGIEGVQEMYNIALENGEKVVIDGIEQAADGTIKYLNNIDEDGMQIVGEVINSGFVVFEGIVPYKESATVFYNKIVTFFTIRMVIELCITIFLMNTFINAITKKGIFGTTGFAKMMMILFTGCLLGFKLVSIIFDKFLGNEVYSIIHILLQIIFVLIIFINSEIVKIIACSIVIIFITLFLISLLLPGIPITFNFVNVLVNYTDFEFYTKDIIGGIIGFITASKLNDIIILIYYIITICLFDPAALMVSWNIFQSKIFPDFLLEKKSDNLIENPSVKSTQGGRNKKIKNKK
tara:strand:- start:248 stop:1381 length:1134 start_codon:yes stop_codon:yes gene_type:complete